MYIVLWTYFLPTADSDIGGPDGSQIYKVRCEVVTEQDVLLDRVDVSDA